jgi:hypothetical protein
MSEAQGRQWKPGPVIRVEDNRNRGFGNHRQLAKERDSSKTGVRKLPDGGPFQYRNDCQDVPCP